MLRKEVQKIESKDIRKFVEEALAKADPKFWESPSSSSGKRHPPEDNGKGGLIRHIQKGVVVVEQFARRASFSPREIDMALTGIILHDICKNGVPWREETNSIHGFIASQWLEQFELKDETAKRMILDAIRYHMAPWCHIINPFEDRVYSKQEMMKNLEELRRALTNPGRIELAVREGDYWSSRQNMSFLPGVCAAIPKDEVHDSPEESPEKTSKKNPKPKLSTVPPIRPI